MTGWSPLLEGPLRAEAQTRVDAIATALARDADDWPLADPDHPNGVRSVSLALGRSGLALFHAWHHAALNAPGAADHAQRMLGEAVELLPERTMDESLYCGFPGVAWATEHVMRVLGAEMNEDPVEGIDEALLEVFEDPAFAPAYDLIGGLAGLGVHALERRARRTGPPLAERVLARLESMARPQTEGLSWPSGTPTRRALQDDVKPEDIWFNVGLSHGVPGVLAILARLATFPELCERARRLLAGGVTWFRAQRMPPDSISAFPDYVAPGKTSEPARLAWCYGDPGVAAALLAAARALGDAALESFAIEVAHVAARRPLDTTQVVDTGLCHGSAGIAHVFHRLHRATGDTVCRDAALAWFERCLARVEDRPNIAGFPTFSFDRNRDGEFIEDPALLTGAAGTGLALIAAISDREPAWDRFLLLDRVD